MRDGKHYAEMYRICRFKHNALLRITYIANDRRIEGWPPGAPYLSSNHRVR